MGPLRHGHIIFTGGVAMANIATAHPVKSPALPKGLTNLKLHF